MTGANQLDEGGEDIVQKEGKGRSQGDVMGMLFPVVYGISSVYLRFNCGKESWMDRQEGRSLSGA